MLAVMTTLIWTKKILHYLDKENITDKSYTCTLYIYMNDEKIATCELECSFPRNNRHANVALYCLIFNQKNYTQRNWGANDLTPRSDAEIGTRIQELELNFFLTINWNYTSWITAVWDGEKYLLACKIAIIRQITTYTPLPKSVYGPTMIDGNILIHLLVYKTKIPYVSIDEDEHHVMWKGMIQSFPSVSSHIQKFFAYLQFAPNI